MAQTVRTLKHFLIKYHFSFSTIKYPGLQNNLESSSSSHLTLLPQLQTWRPFSIPSANGALLAPFSSVLSLLRPIFCMSVCVCFYVYMYLSCTLDVTSTHHPLPLAALPAHSPNLSHFSALRPASPSAARDDGASGWAY